MFVYNFLLRANKVHIHYKSNPNTPNLSLEPFSIL